MISPDTFALLRSIAGAPETFAAVEDDLQRLAIGSVTRLLKARDMTLERLRALHAAVGAEALAFILGHDTVTDADIAGLVRKLDRHWPLLAGVSTDARRSHLLSLASGAAAPTGAETPSRPVRSAAARAEPAAWSRAMSAGPPEVG